MTGTFSRIYIQLVFAVQNRDSIINPTWEEELYKYIAGIVRNKAQKVLAINGMPDHIHIFIGLKPSCRISDLVREIKKSSTEFIKEKEFCQHKFRWQEGYGVFSYGHSQIDAVIKYIRNQKEHHAHKSFQDEYVEFLNRFGIEFNEQYLFRWIQ